MLLRERGRFREADNEADCWRREELAFFASPDPDEPPLSDGSQTPITMQEVRQTAQMGRRDLLACITVDPHGVLGLQRQEGGDDHDAAPQPDDETVILDPAGLRYIQKGPQGAGGVSAHIYSWLGIHEQDSFPDSVKAAITEPLMAKLHDYCGRRCIHVVGPDLRRPSITGEQALIELTTAYRNAFRELYPLASHTFAYHR